MSRQHIDKQICYRIWVFQDRHEAFSRVCLQALTNGKCPWHGQVAPKHEGEK
jgi:hypothetical protein